jgi:hypothetical protein
MILTPNHMMSDDCIHEELLTGTVTYPRLYVVPLSENIKKIIFTIKLKGVSIVASETNQICDGYN